MRRVRAVGALRTFEDESMNLLTRFTTNATGARAVVIDDTIRQLKATGIWAKLDCFYMLATAASDQALLNWKSTNYSLTTSGTVFFTGVGYEGNGVNGRLDTGFNPTTAGSPFYTLNSSSIGAYSRSNIADAPTMGNENARIVPRTAGFTMAARLNGTTTVTPANTSAQRFSHAFRTGSTEFRTRAGGVTTLHATASSADANQNIWLLAYNAGAPVYGTQDIAHAYIGGGLTEAEVIALEGIVTTHLSRVGAAV